MKKYLLLLMICLTALESTRAQGSAYCTPKSASSCDYDFIISNVTFNTINRTSGCDGFTTGGYSYYNTGPNTTIVHKGNSYMLSVTVGITYEQGASAWIDWNQNNIFENNEMIFSEVFGTASANYFANVTIPVTASNGNTRLRVRSSYSNLINDLKNNPCGDIEYGETEDYLITIDDLTCIPPNIMVTGDTKRCDSVIATASGGSSYLWSGGATPYSPENTFYTSGAYLLQITNSSGCTAVSTQNVVVDHIKPAVTIAVSPSVNICNGTSVTFTTSVTDGGSSPSFQWKKNEVIITNANGATYTTDSSTNNDVITCIVSNSCASSEASNDIKMFVSSISQTPEILISSNLQSPMDGGAEITFTATNSFGGSSPQFQWKLNGVNVGNNSPIYKTSSLQNNSLISCVLTSNATCVSTLTDTSNLIFITIKDYCIPKSYCRNNDIISNVIFNTINRSSGCDSRGTGSSYYTSGTIVHKGNSYLLSVGTRGSAPQGAAAWIDYNQNNHFEDNEMIFTDFAGTLNAIYTRKVLIPANAVTGNTRLRIRSQYRIAPIFVCDQNEFYGETEDYLITIDSDACTPPSVVIAGDSLGCNSVQLVASGGTAYLWSGGNNLTSASNIFTTSAIYIVQVTNASGCTSVDTKKVSVDTQIKPTINITVSPSFSICTGTNVIFKSVTTNAGSAPKYKWQKNGIDIPNATDSIYQSNSLTDNNIITCIISNVCTLSDTSNAITISVVSAPTAPTISISSNYNNTIPSDTSVTFSAVTTLGGTSPVYQWKINNINAGTNSPFFITKNLGNNDVINCTLTSNATCAITPTATSNSIIMSIDYCNPESICTYNDIISNVTFNTINRSSECDGNKGYSYFNASPNTTSVNKGNSYALSVSTVTNNYEGVVVWIDYNQNNNFESGEMVFSGSPGSSNTTYNATITIPPSALAGNTRMRVRCISDINATNACENPLPYFGDAITIPLGETEDYLITINANACLPPVISISGNSVGCDKVTLTASGGNSYSWNGGNTPNSASNTFTKSGDYIITATSAEGCVTSISKTVVISNEGAITKDTIINSCNNTIVFRGIIYDSSTIVRDTIKTLKGCDSIYNVAHINITRISLSQITNLLPVDNSIIPDVASMVFSWAPVPDALSYDFYIWKATDTIPTVPFKNVQSINLTYYDLSFDYKAGTSYQWKVVAKYENCTSSSSVLNFRSPILPDLKLTAAQLPSTGSAGSTVNISWTVENIGAGSTNASNWRDYIYLSTDKDLRKDDDILLTSVSNQSYLQPGQGYTQTKAITLPKDLIGTYYLFVITDNIDAICKEDCNIAEGSRVTHNSTVDESNENNNYKYNEITIGYGPLPDLQVTSIGMPGNVFAGDRVNITYKVENKGTATAITSTANLICPVRRNWSDRFFITKDSVFIEANATNLAWYPSNAIEFLSDCDKLTKDIIAVGDSYTNVNNVLIPHNFYGTYYIFAKADGFEDVYEGPYNDNNLLRSDPITVTLKPPADLIISKIDVAQSAISGQEFKVSWAEKNIGANATDEFYWTDSIYISKENVFDSLTAIKAGYITRINRNDLQPDSTFLDSLTFLLPNGLTGAYYVYVKADAKNNVFEYDKEENNGLMSRAFTMSLPPAADLTITRIIAPDSVIAEEPFTIKWNIKNLGQAPASAIFKDNIYCTTDSTLNATNIYNIGSYNHLYNIPAGNDSIYSSTVSVPAQFGNKKVYFFITTDAENNVFEHLAENNNRGSSSSSQSSGATYVNAGNTNPDLNPDLKVVTFTAPSSAFSGNDITATWKIVNAGSGRTPVKFWTDRVYLSSDNVWDGSDQQLASIGYTSSLNPDSGYSVSANIKIPNTASGNYFLIVVTDVLSDVTNDSLRSNNTSIIPMSVTLSPGADLIITKIDTITTPLYAGSQFYFKYTIKNQGTSPTNVEEWFDGLYFSTSQTQYNNQSGSQQHLGILLPGQTYSDSVLVSVPSYISGNYFMIFRTDNRKEVYEGANSKTNNISIKAIIIQPLSEYSKSDLIVSSFPLPDKVLIGQTLSSGITIKNIGLNPTLGNYSNALYLSTDKIYNGTADPLVATQLSTVVIKPGESVTNTLSGTVLVPKAGNYYGIARTNITATVNEETLSNNNKASDSLVSVDAAELLLNVPKTELLSYGKLSYYKVVVGANLDLLVTLTAQTIYASGSNYIYVAFNRVPTQSDYDEISIDPTTVNQTLLVPTTRAGTYYIAFQYSGSNESATLLAKSIPFSIIKVTPEKVGQSTVTTDLYGGGFKNNSKIYLKTVAGTVISEGKIEAFINSTKLKVKWDLQSVALGAYNISVINPDGNEAILSNGLEVQKSTGYMVDYKPLIPNQIRRNQGGLFSFTCKNTGNINVGVIQGDLTFAGYAVVKEVTVKGKVKKQSQYHPDTVLYKKADWYDAGDLKKVPFICVGLAPGEEFSITLYLSNFKENTFAIFPKIYSFSSHEFARQQIGKLEILREAILQKPENISVANRRLLLIKASNRDSFISGALKTYYEAGLLTPADAEGIDPSCPACLLQIDTATLTGQSSYNFSSVSSPALVEINHDTVFENGQSYLFKISKSLYWPGYTGSVGVAGQSPGWNLMRVNGKLNINSSGANPVIINLASLSYKNSPGSLAGWYPAKDTSFIMTIATKGINNFSPDKFVIDATLFQRFNNTYGGYFSLRLNKSNIAGGADTIYLAYKAYVPLAGEPGLPGITGVTGEPGSPGGQGGPGDGLKLPGNGGRGGDGGKGSSTGIAGGDGGSGGIGGIGGIGQNGGTGGMGGNGGNGGVNSNGGDGGTGGSGGPGGIGGNPGFGGNGGNGGNSGGGSGRGGYGGVGGASTNGVTGGINNGFSDSLNTGNSNDNTSLVEIQSASASGRSGQSGASGGTGNCSGSTINSSTFNQAAKDLVNQALFLSTSDVVQSLASITAGKLYGDNCAISAMLGCGFTALGAAEAVAEGAWWGPLTGTLACELMIADCFNQYITGEKNYPGSEKINDVINKLGCIGSLTGLAKCVIQSQFENNVVTTSIVSSCDPNEIIGPASYGSALLVSNKAVLPYSIHFENDSLNATTAAQKVIIRQPIHNNLDPLSFRVGDFSFANRKISVGNSKSNYFKVLDLANTLGFNVEVTAGVDVVKRELFWVFQTIDPATGLPPVNPLSGFLPVNDVEGNGLGYVNYTIKANSSVVTGDSITAKANIFFDTNDPISTNKWLNTIDAVTPVSKIDNFSLDHNTISFSWKGNDEPKGSGIKNYDLYVSEDKNKFYAYQTGLTNNISSFIGAAGHTYSFFTLATDNVAHVEEMKDSGDITVVIPGDDLDGDGYTKENDCDDNNPNIHPGAIEICNGIDDDCDGLIDEGLTQITYYRDADGDGYGNLNNSISGCSASVPTGYVLNNTDCSDNNPNIHPGATEICNGIDDNCDGIIDEGVTTTFYRDLDNDGYGKLSSSTVQACSAPLGYVASNDDCNDNNANIHPGAVELCNGIDDNCNGLIDEGLTQITYYRDADNDGYGDANKSIKGCSAIAPVGYVLNNTDCNDNNANIHPGAVELCNGIDDNCNGLIDEGLTQITYYRDADGDGYGDASKSIKGCSATASTGYVLNSTDCKDNNANIHPGAVELCNGIDDNCNGLIDEGLTQITYYRDADGDGYGDASKSIKGCSAIAPVGYVLNNTDCNDNNANIHPGAVELCNGIDDNCNGLIDEGLTQINYYRDADNDGYGDASKSIKGCSAIAPVGYVLNNTDCNDNNANIHPGAVELCNGIDDNCNGLIDEGLTQITYYRDADNDGYGDANKSIKGCSASAPVGYVTNSTDCKDNNASIHPGATELCNGIDDNCNGLIDEGLTQITYYRDADGDGYGDATISLKGCSAIAPTGYVTNITDCKDNNASIHPGATELCNGIDDNCNGLIDEGLTQITYYRDADNDGYGDATKSLKGCSASAPVGYVTNSTDCKDNNASIHPGATELCNGIDDNCNGLIDEGLTQITYYRDADGDGYGDATISLKGCSAIAPTGYVTNSTDCKDNNASIHPGATELCNGIDDDCDGLIDEGLTQITYYRDADNDGYGDVSKSLKGCSAIAPTGYVLNSTDCNDNHPTIHPGAVELCNGIDDDCDGLIDENGTTTFYRDLDKDGYGKLSSGTIQACSAPAGYVSNSTDCNDNNANVHPGALEICNGIDDDCDGLIDEGLALIIYYRDADGDTYGDPLNFISVCYATPPVGYVKNNYDCNDNSKANKPEDEMVVMCHNGKPECVKAKEMVNKNKEGWTLGPCTQAQCAADETIMCYNGKAECIKNKDVAKKKTEKGWSVGPCSPTLLLTTRTEVSTDIAFSENVFTEKALVKEFILNVFPNPSNNTFNLNVKSPSSENIVVMVFDYLGREVYAATGSVNDTYRFGKKFAVGNYFVRVIQDNKQATIKLIKL